MKKLLFILLTFAALSGCKTDFETIAPYRETMVIYGLLNPNDHVQYIRISKAFLGEGNALVMAQQADSVYYGNNLEVTIDRYFGNILKSSKALVYIYDTLKEPGIFSYPGQVLYSYSDSVYSDTSTYKITVKNTKTNLVATSSTHLIPNFTIGHPSTNQKIDFTSAPDFYNFDIVSTDFGKVYGIEMKALCTEINTITGDTIHHEFEWNLDQQTTDIPLTTLNFPFKKSQYLQLIDNSIHKASDRKYLFPGIEAYIVGGTEEFYTYLNVTAPSYGIVQEKPVYSNITNGVGLFASRNMRLRFITLDQKTLDYLNGLYN